MLLTMLRIMKGNGFVAGLFIFLAVGFVFPSLYGDHGHGALAVVHQESYGESVALGQRHEHGDFDVAHVSHACSYEHGDSHSGPAQCNDDCCAPGCCALSVTAEVGVHPGYFEMGRFMRTEDRHLAGLSPLTADRPPRA